MRAAFLRLGGLLLGLTLSTTLLAGERIYLMAGQSNMMGLAKTYQLPTTLKRTPANVTFYYQGRPRKLAQYSHFGPEVSFAHQIARAFPQDQHIIIKFAATGSHIQQWLPGQPLYKGMLRQLGFSVKRDHPKIEAILWMQGESDALNHARASQYAPRLSRFIHQLRKDLKSPQTLFVMGEVDPIGKDFPMVDLVRQHQHQVHSQVSRTVLTPAAGIGKIYDHIHYNTQGQVELGKRFAQAYIQHAR